MGVWHLTSCQQDNMSWTMRASTLEHLPTMRWLHVEVRTRSVHQTRPLQSRTFLLPSQCMPCGARWRRLYASMRYIALWQINHRQSPKPRLTNADARPSAGQSFTIDGTACRRGFSFLSGRDWRRQWTWPRHGGTGCDTSSGAAAATNQSSGGIANWKSRHASWARG